MKSLKRIDMTIKDVFIYELGKGLAGIVIFALVLGLYYFFTKGKD